LTPPRFCATVLLAAVPPAGPFPPAAAPSPRGGTFSMRIWIISGLFAAALLATVLFFRCRGATEPTLMSVCWQGDQAVYAGGCEPLIWEKIPARIYAPDYGEDFDYAIKFWGGAAYRVDDQNLADIIVEQGSVSSGAMSASHRGGRCYITVKIPGDPRENMLRFEHEIGHCFGLAHDRGNSIMNPDLSEPDGQRLWVITAADRAALNL